MSEREREREMMGVGDKGREDCEGDDQGRER